VSSTTHGCSQGGLDAQRWNPTSTPWRPSGTSSSWRLLSSPHQRTDPTTPPPAGTSSNRPCPFAGRVYSCERVAAPRPGDCRHRGRLRSEVQPRRCGIRWAVRCEGRRDMGGLDRRGGGNSHCRDTDLRSVIVADRGKQNSRHHYRKSRPSHTRHGAPEAEGGVSKPPRQRSCRPCCVTVTARSRPGDHRPPREGASSLAGRGLAGGVTHSRRSCCPLEFRRWRRQRSA